MFVRGITIFHSKVLAPGETPTFRALPRTSGLARGKHPHSVHFRLARSPHPRRPQGFGNLPKSRPGFREIPYATIGVIPVVLRGFVPKYPARAGVPYDYEASPPLSGLCQIWCVACRNRPTNHLISNLDP